MSVHLRQENVLKYRKMYKIIVSDGLYIDSC